MKKFLALTALLVLLGSTSAFAVISGSSHDFSTTGWTTEICAPCHTPHNAIAGAGPLWSHATTGETFTMYSSPTIDMIIAASPQGISLACLSCHDGVTNMDDFIGGPATPNTPMTGTAALGTDLSNDHPISLTYDDTQDPGNYQTLATVSLTALEFFGNASTPDQLECATCHDVHNGTTNSSMLRITMNGSAICLTCHIK